MNTVEESLIRAELKSIFERLQLLDSAGGDLSQKLVTTYVSSTRERIRRIQDSVTQRAWAAINAELHDLKSTSLNLGAVALGELFRELEKTDCRNDPESFSAALLAAEAVFTEISSRLKERF